MIEIGGVMGSIAEVLIKEAPALPDGERALLTDGLPANYRNLLTKGGFSYV